MTTIKALLLFSLLFSLVGCSTTSINKLNYNQSGFYSGSEGGNKKFKEIGPIVETVSGFSWDSCEKLVDQAMENTKKNIKAEGGDAIINVRWSKGDFQTAVPTCRNSYGWWALYIVGGLGPWVKSVELTGTIVKNIE